MLRKIVIAVILVPLGIVIIAFAVANRQVVTVSFDPFSAAEPAAALSLPLFALMIVLLIIGVIVGGAAAWLRQSEWRRRARRLEREVDDLRRQLDVFQGANESTIVPQEGNPPARLKLKPPVR